MAKGIILKDILKENVRIEENEKEIEFLKSVNTSKGELMDNVYEPEDYDHIILLTRGNFDLMYAYDADISEGAVFLGHWNSGTF